MEREKFIKIITNVINEVIDSTNQCDVYTCNSLGRHSAKIRKDYEICFRTDRGYIPVFFGHFGKEEDIKQTRLNALTMYMIQALAFKTYEEL